MAAFAVADDLEDFLQVDDLHTAAATQALRIASGLIRSHVGWSITEESDVVLATQGTGGDAIWLPTKRLTDVSSVEVDGTLLTSGDHYRWNTSGRLRRVGGRWPRLEQSVEVTFTHGYADVPDDVFGVCLALAARMYNNPEGLRSWSVDGLSETIASPTADVGLVLTEAEKTALDPYVLDGVA